MKRAVLFLFLTIVWFVVLFPKDILWQGIKSYIYTEKGLQIDAKEADIKLYILYDKIILKKIKILNSFDIDSFQATYNVFDDPFMIKLNGKFRYGDFRGIIDLKSKKGFILFKDKKAIVKSVFKSYLKKTKEGYRYEFDI